MTATTTMEIALLEQQILDGHMTDAVAYLSSLSNLNKEAGGVCIRDLSCKARYRLLTCLFVSTEMKTAVLDAENIYRRPHALEPRQIRGLWKRVFPHYASSTSPISLREAGACFHLFYTYLRSHAYAPKPTRWAQGLLRNPATPRQFKLGVAEDYETDRIVFGILIEDDDPEVRLRVAQVLPQASSVYLARLVRDPIAEVRLAAASNRHASSRALLLVEDDPDVRVRLAVAAHSHASRATLKRLVQDANSRAVREQVQANLEARS